MVLYLNGFLFFIQQFSCECGKKFTLNKNLLAHQRKFHGTVLTSYVCTECEIHTEFSSKYTLKYHFRDEHKRHLSVAELDECEKRKRITRAGENFQYFIKDSLNRVNSVCHSFVFQVFSLLFPMFFNSISIIRANIASSPLAFTSLTLSR